MQRLPLLPLLASALVLPCLSFAAEPPTTPILRIEAEMHTAMIWRVGADEAGRMALTMSADKTARLWELPSGSLLRVLRPPIGEGEEGKLYAGSLSPDGRFAAVGGSTGYDWDKTNYIYLFDTETGRLQRRLEGLPNVVIDLAFSAQGRFLAAVLGEGNGLRVWEVASGLEVGRDEDYGDRSNSVHWHQEDRLVTTCWDGSLRLYEMANKKLRRTVKAAARGGQQPFSARFSPDGKRIAVGFDDSTALAVVDGKDLSFLFAPDTSGVDNGDISSVTWTDDGTTLAAGGRWGVAGSRPIRRWAQAGRGPPQDTAAAPNTLMDLRPLPGGRILFGSGDPAWGILENSASPQAKAQTLGTPPLADYRNNLEGFRLSEDGATMTFGYEPFGKSPALFSVMSRELIQGEEALSKRIASHPGGLKPPLTEGLSVTEWENKTTPKLAGKPLTLKQYETSRSLAIARDAGSFFLGTEWYLRSHSAKGEERWKVPAPGVTWAVNLADKDRLAVAAYGDGTIRWHRADTGKELLAFFPHADRKRWVLWTPEGYFDCSPGGENLIGWHLNRGKDREAEFISSGRLFRHFYRPEIVRRALLERRSGADIAQEMGLTFDLKKALAEMPKVSLPDITDGHLAASRRFSITVEATDPAGDLEEVTLFHNGVRREPDGPGEKRGALLRTPFTATLVPGANELRAVATTTDGVESEPVKISLRYEGERAQARLWMVAVGIDLYKNPQQNLNFCRADVEAMTGALQRGGTALFAGTKVIPVHDADATREKIEAAFAEVTRQAKAEDVFVFLYAGHGVMSEGSEDKQNRAEFYLVPHDVTQIYGNDALLAKRGLSARVLRDLLGKVPARKQLMVLDACQAGGIVELLAARGAAEQKALAQLARSTGMTVLASARGEQFANEVEKLGHGIFTQALLEAFSIKGDANRDGQITVGEIQLYLNEAVPELSEKHLGTAQYPMSYSSGQDFPIGLVP